MKVSVTFHVNVHVRVVNVRCQLRLKHLNRESENGMHSSNIHHISAPTLAANAGQTKSYQAIGQTKCNQLNVHVKRFTCTCTCTCTHQSQDTNDHNHSSSLIPWRSFHFFSTFARSASTSMYDGASGCSCSIRPLVQRGPHALSSALSSSSVPKRFASMKSV